MPTPRMDGGEEEETSPSGPPKLTLPRRVRLEDRGYQPLVHQAPLLGFLSLYAPPRPCDRRMNPPLVPNTIPLGDSVRRGATLAKVLTM